MLHVLPYVILLEYFKNEHFENYHLYNSTLHIAKEYIILLFDDCAKFMSCMFMFCVFHNMFPTVITNIFVILSSIHGYHCSRYLDINFKMFSCRLKCRRNFVVHKGIVKWNNLPVMLKTINSAEKIKKHLKLRILPV